MKKYQRGFASGIGNAIGQAILVLIVLDVVHPYSVGMN